MNDNKKVQGIDSKIWELSDEIVLPINVFIYLANDRAYNNPTASFKDSSLCGFGGALSGFSSE